MSEYYIGNYEIIKKEFDIYYRFTFSDLSYHNIDRLEAKTIIETYNLRSATIVEAYEYLLSLNIHYNKSCCVAFSLAEQKHKNQVDKAGCSYLLHPLHVANNFFPSNEKIVAILHDILEDTDTNEKMLYDMGFEEKIVAAIKGISRKKGEDYFDYIKRVKKNQLATTVKICDLKHNLDLSRIDIPTKRDYERMEKYRRALLILEEK